MSQESIQEQFVAPLWDEIHTAAAAYVATGQVAPIAFNGLVDFIQTGHRQIFETQYFARRKQLAVLILENVKQPTPQSLALLEDVLWAVCNEYSWAVPAHLPIADGQLGAESQTYIDLFAAETAQTLAAGLYLLKGQLSQLIITRVKQALQTRIFAPFLAHAWFWETMPNNWSAVVPSAVGMAGLYSLDLNGDQLPLILKKVSACLDNYLATFQADGACAEGIGYWVYGFGYFMYYADLLAKVCGDTHYFKDPKVIAIGSFPMHTQITEDEYLPFSDYTGSDVPAGLLALCRQRLGVETPIQTTINHLDADHAYRFAHIAGNVFEGMPQASKPITAQYYYPDAQWLLARNDPQALFFAAKAGGNAESHNHNDVGHFVVATAGQLVLTDLGAGEYTYDYFADATRYTFLTTSSKGHSVPIINGQFQKGGPFKATGVQQYDNRFAMDLAAVYPPAAHVIQAKRSFVWNLAQRALALHDEFGFDQATNQVTESFVSLMKPTVIAHVVQVGQCQIDFGEVVPYIEQATYHDHYDRHYQVYLIRADYSAQRQLDLTISFQL